MSEKGEGLGRKAIDCSQYQAFYRTPISAHQSQRNIRNDNPTSETRQDQNIYQGTALTTNGRRMTRKTTVGLGRGRRSRRDTSQYIFHSFSKQEFNRFDD